MNNIRYTLLTDGSSDKSLMKILDWLIESLAPEIEIQSEWADLARLPKPPKKLSERILVSLDLYPCDLLFIHRDAENERREKRISEIEEALTLLDNQMLSSIPDFVPVIPIRMTEAWLLIDEQAIRKAAGNPRGRQTLALPSPRRLESIPDPKDELQKLLKQASSMPPRRWQTVSNHRIADLITNFTPLEQLSAFQELKVEVKQVLEKKYVPENFS